MATIRGTFKSKTGMPYSLSISGSSLSSNNTIRDVFDSSYVNIDEPNIFFGPDPIHIEYDLSDPTQHMKIGSATITLVSNMNLVYMFGIRETNLSESQSEKLEVSIFSGNTSNYNNCIFQGYIEDDIFSQNYAYKYSSFTFTVLDKISQTKYRYAPETNLANYDFIPLNLNMTSGAPYSFPVCFFNLGGSPYIFNQQTIFNNNLSISSDIFGCNTDIKDNWWSVYDTYEEILKYLNLYAIQRYDHTIIAVGKPYMMAYPADYTYHTVSNVPDIEFHYTADDAASNDTSISNSESYSVIKVNCDIEPLEEILDLTENTVTDETMDSPYRNKQLYMTEIISLGKGHSATNAFYEELYMNANLSHYDGIYKIENYAYVLRNSAWDFSGGYEDSQRTAQDYTEHFETSQNSQYCINQHNILKWMAQDTDTYIRPAFISFGRSKKIDLHDNSIESSISTTNYLYIPIWGKEQHTQSNSLIDKFNRYSSEHPLALYTPYQNITLTPSSQDTINYIIISGKILLNPLQQVTGTKWNTTSIVELDDITLEGGKNYNSVHTLIYLLQNSTENVDVQRSFPSLWYLRSTNTYADTIELFDQRGTDPNGHLVPMPDNDQGAYYTQKFWECTDPATNNYVQSAASEKWIYGFLDNSKNKQMKFEYSSREEGDTDTVSKVPILKCELKVGDKYCCELEEGIDKYEWHTLDEAQLLGIEPVIYLGIDPKINDFIIGQKYPIRNSISDAMNLDGDGMAIPIKSTDRVSGKFEFKIISPANPIWKDVEYKSGSFWHSSTWNDYYRYIMQKTQAIMIESIKIETQTDNALANVDMTTSDNDLVYASDMNPRYSEELEVDLSICTGLSSDEAAEYKMKRELSKSYVIDGNTDAPYLGIRDENEELEFYIKPEEKICDSLFKELCRPRTIIHTTVKRGTGQKINESNLYQHVNDLYYIDYWNPYKPVKLLKADFSLKNETVECEFKEFIPSLMEI